VTEPARPQADRGTRGAGFRHIIWSLPHSHRPRASALRQAGPRRLETIGPLSARQLGDAGSLLAMQSVDAPLLVTTQRGSSEIV
jgi:hypothetical protein